MSFISVSLNKQLLLIMRLNENLNHFVLQTKRKLIEAHDKKEVTSSDILQQTLPSFKPIKQ